MNKKKTKTHIHTHTYKLQRTVEEVFASLWKTFLDMQQLFCLWKWTQLTDNTKSSCALYTLSRYLLSLQQPAPMNKWLEPKLMPPAKTFPGLFSHNVKYTILHQKEVSPAFIFKSKTVAERVHLFVFLEDSFSYATENHISTTKPANLPSFYSLLRQAWLWLTGAKTSANNKANPVCRSKAESRCKPATVQVAWHFRPLSLWHWLLYTQRLAACTRELPWIPHAQGCEQLLQMSTCSP